MNGSMLHPTCFAAAMEGLPGAFELALQADESQMKV